jgi:Arc/MetJ-type ribon-helix-helix transcriptional regulator
MSDMPTITVRISEEERRDLLKRGSLSETVREAIELYLNTRKSQELIKKLEKLQRENAIRTTTAEEVRLINEDRKR